MNDAAIIGSVVFALLGGLKMVKDWIVDDETEYRITAGGRRLLSAASGDDFRETHKLVEREYRNWPLPRYSTR